MAAIKNMFFPTDPIIIMGHNIKRATCREQRPPRCHIHASHSRTHHMCNYMRAQFYVMHVRAKPVAVISGRTLTLSAPRNSSITSLLCGSAAEHTMIIMITSRRVHAPQRYIPLRALCFRDAFQMPTPSAHERLRSTLDARRCTHTNSAMQHAIRAIALEANINIYVLLYYYTCSIRVVSLFCQCVKEMCLHTKSGSSAADNGSRCDAVMVMGGMLRAMSACLCVVMLLEKWFVPSTQTRVQEASMRTARGRREWRVYRKRW